MSDSDAAKRYTCAQCGGTFSTDWSEEEVAAEAAEVFPDQIEAGQDFAVVCDVCYRVMMKPPQPGDVIIDLTKQGGPS